VPPQGSPGGALAVRAALGGDVGGGNSGGRADLTGLSGEKYRYLRQVTINFLEAPEDRQHELWAPVAAVLGSSGA